MTDFIKAVEAKINEKIPQLNPGDTAVSYTHLTLPTSDLVQISVVAVSLKKKKTHYAQIPVQPVCTRLTRHIANTKPKTPDKKENVI